MLLLELSDASCDIDCAINLKSGSVAHAWTILRIVKVRCCAWSQFFDLLVSLQCLQLQSARLGYDFCQDKVLISQEEAHEPWLPQPAQRRRRT